jgi:hypothetical protein
MFSFVPTDIYFTANLKIPDASVNFAGSVALKAVVMKNSIFWGGDITPCSTLKIDRYFGGSFRLQLQVQKISQARN